MIHEIKNILKEIDQNVQTGICKKQGESWDCILVKKEKIERSGTSRLDYSFYVSVRIIREDEIPEGMEQLVIDKMKEIGWKKSDAPGQYEYAIDSNEIVVEICKLDFVKVKKRMC